VAVVAVSDCLVAETLDAGDNLFLAAFRECERVLGFSSHSLARRSD